MNFSDTEQRRALQLNRMIGLAAIVFLAVFGSNAYLNQQYLLANTLFGMILWATVFLTLMQWKHDPRYGSLGITVAATYAFGYLIASGGVDGTGPLWCYPLLVIITFLMGLKKGAAVVAGLLVLALILLFVPSLPIEVAEYPRSFKIRFVASFSALSIMALIYEYMRVQSRASYQQISSELDAASRTDELTGLANRREMQELLQLEYARYRREGNEFSVVMADLDHFKQVNDTHGHQVGDELLRAVARLFAASLRAGDSVARWGGEEFLVLLPHTNALQAVAVGEKLRRLVTMIDLSAEGMNDLVTSSFGAQSIAAAADVDDLVNQADALLYRAKRNGRNRVAGPHTAEGSNNTTDVAEPGPALDPAQAPQAVGERQRSA